MAERERKIKIVISVTLPTMAKFYKSLGNFSYGLFRLWQTFVPALENLYATGQMFIVVNGQRLKNNLAIWSH